MKRWMIVGRFPGRRALGSIVLPLLLILPVMITWAQECPPAVRAYDQAVVPEEVVQGEIITVTAWVQNTSCDTLGAFEVSAYYDVVDENDPDAHLISTQTVPGLDPCEEKQLTFYWDTTDIPPGTYPIQVWADSSKKFNQEPEGDNICKARVITRINPVPPLIRASKTFVDIDGGLPESGDTVEYEIIIGNYGLGDQSDNSGPEFVDEIPAFMAYIDGSASATSGTISFDASGNSIVWNGSIPALGSVTINFQVNIDEAAPGGSLICNQGVVTWDIDGDATNDSQTPTDDPSTLAPEDPTCLVINSPPQAHIDVSKTVTDLNGDSPEPGDIVEYEIIIGNAGNGDQQDNPGDEFVDYIPPWMSYVKRSAQATSGKVRFHRVSWLRRVLTHDEDRGNWVTWNGSIPAGGSVIITFKTKIDKDAPAELIICNQGTVNWDTDGDGTNDTAEPTDDPDTVKQDDPTCLLPIASSPDVSPPPGQVDPALPADPPAGCAAPTLSEWGQIALIGLLALAFTGALWRRNRLLPRRG